MITLNDFIRHRRPHSRSLLDELNPCSADVATEIALNIFFYPIFHLRIKSFRFVYLYIWMLQRNPTKTLRSICSPWGRRELKSQISLYRATTPFGRMNLSRKYRKGCLLRNLLYPRAGSFARKVAVPWDLFCFLVLFFPTAKELIAKFRWGMLLGQIVLQRLVKSQRTQSVFYYQVNKVWTKIVVCIVN